MIITIMNIFDMKEEDEWGQFINIEAQHEHVVKNKKSETCGRGIIYPLIRAFLSYVGYNI